MLHTFMEALGQYNYQIILGFTLKDSILGLAGLISLIAKKRKSCKLIIDFYSQC
jgi:hypothetical protein